MADRNDPRDQQSETVSEPHRGGEAPTRSKQPWLWLVIGLLLVLALGIALVVAAIQEA